MVDRTEEYAELRRQYPNLSDAWWDLMRERDTIRDERDALRAALAHLVGNHTAKGTPVPVETLRELIYTPDADLPTKLDELTAAVFPPTSVPPTPTHGTGCPPGCCGAGVRQWR